MRLRVGPCSAGTVKMSPRAEKAARFAFGLSEKPDTWFAAETRPGRRASWSVGTWMGTGRAAPEPRSKISREPAFSYTMRRFALSALGQRTSHWSSFVSWESSPESTS